MVAVHCNEVKKWTLDGVCCDVYQGECIILTGPPSCGKSTLLSVLGGLLKPTSGTVQVLGKDLFSLSDKERSLFRLENIGFFFQSDNLINALSVLDNVLVPLRFIGISDKIAKEMAEEKISQMGMTKKKDFFPPQLSQGEKQLVGLARALVNHPKLLLLDEPTIALDHQMGVLIMTIIRDLVLDHGMTAIASIKDVRLHPFASRIFKMRSGQIVDIFGESAIGEVPPPYLKI